MRRRERGPWYLLTGLVLGAVLGLAYAWMVQPVRYINTSPATLRTDFKDRYRALIASAYAANGDLVRARARLELLQDENPYQTLAGQAQRTLAEGRSPNEARSLGLLAAAIGQPLVQPGSGGQPTGVIAASPTPALPPSSPSPTLSHTATLSLTATLPPTATLPVSATLPGSTLNPTATLVITPGLSLTPDFTPQSAASRTPFPRTPTVTPTPLPTRTPTPTPGAPFVLDTARQVCDADLTTPLLQVEALDAARIPVPGVEVLVQWPNGQDRFFTGLKPEIGSGYGDFAMTPGVVYQVQIAGGGQPVPNLSAPECEARGGTRYWGSWMLVFVQP